MKLRLLTIVCSAFTVVAILLGLTPAANAAEPARPTPTASHVVAQGPGWLIVGSGSRSTGRPSAQPGMSPSTVYDCGWVTCSVYLSRSQTRWLNYNIALAGGGLAGLGAFCGLMALVSNVAAIFVGVGCAVVVAIYGAFIINAITHAAGDNGCFRIRYPAWAFYDDHSGFCHNT